MTYDITRKVAPRPRIDRRRPVLRSSAVRMPNPIIVTANVSGTPGSPRANRKPIGSETTATTAGAEKPGVNERV